VNWCAFYGRQCQDPQRGGDGGTHLGAAPDGLEDDEVRDLAEPGDVLRAREDAGAEHRDPRKARAAVAIPRHAHTLSTVLGFLSALAPPQRDWLPQLLKRKTGSDLASLAEIFTLEKTNSETGRIRRFRYSRWS
jgi:hypothetical protein